MEPWTANPRRRAAFHAWLRDVNRYHAVNMTYEGMKRHALKVNHLEEG